MHLISRRSTVLSLAMLLGLSTAAFAQASRQRFQVRAAAATNPPRIDGVLDDAAWGSAAVIDQFTQQEPRLGEPASERTEVRLLFDSGHLYIGVHAFDARPEQITATEMRRDSDRLLDEDSFQFILDTFNDSRNGYMFATTPLGAKLEQQISEEGEGNARGNSNNSNINRDWDGIWDVSARVTDDGWVAEIVVPMTTLRFLPTDEQTWGVNFSRTIRRTNEVVFWAPIPKAYALTRVSQAGLLTGLGGLTQGLDLKLKPFVIAGGRDNELQGKAGASSLKDIGLDARYGLSSGINLDVTVNTDFAQVEADQQQVNLTRFSLFFPEKRDFFLENAGLFNMGTGATFTSAPVQTDLFFSRRIGLSDAGTPVGIVGGARIAGKSGAHNVGLLDIQTEDAFGKPGENFLVGRYSRDVLRRSRVGALFVNKDTGGDSGHYNRTIAIDTNLALGRSLQITSFLAKTATPGLNGKDAAFFGRIAYRDPSWNLWVNYLDVQDNFNAEVGFVQRKGIRATKVYFSPTPRPGRANIRLMEPMYVLTNMTDQNNRLVNRVHHMMVGTTLNDGSFINVIYQKNLDVLDAPFLVDRLRNVKIPVGTYNFDDASFAYNTSPSKRVYERFSYQPSQFYGGTKHAVSAAIGVRASNQLSSEFQVNTNNVKLPYGDFSVNLAILRVDYTFSTRATLRTLTQYNSSTREVTNSVRFNYIYRPGSDLYIVYNDLHTTGLPTDVFAPNDKQLVLKLNYLLQR